jgi:pimeloyl-ACP methyl ester carboxylesterase
MTPGHAGTLPPAARTAADRNPAFDVSDEAVATDLARMRASPVALRRPVVILAGWHAPGVSSLGLEMLLRPVTSARREDFLSISYPFAFSIESAFAKARRLIAARFGHAQELDLIGISMGGLVARRLAGEPSPGASRRVSRIFTLASPHQGAVLADTITPDPASRHMVRGSGFLRDLDARLENDAPDLTCYTLLNDWFVGATRTAPPGHTPIWLRGRTPLERAFSHFLIPRCRPVVADLARRLRGEEPLAHPATPPPRD